MWPLLPSVLALAAMAVVIVFAGIRLTRTADELADRTGLGDAIGAVSDAGRSPAPTRATPSTDPGLDLLSAREREVVQLLARGYTYREIGGRLFISVKTVEPHASNVLREPQLPDRNELTRGAGTDRLL